MHERSTTNVALRRLEFRKEEMTADGFRSAASSILNECGLWHADAVERQPAHVDNDSVRRACARRLWDERARMTIGGRIDAVSCRPVASSFVARVMTVHSTSPPHGPAIPRCAACRSNVLSHRVSPQVCHDRYRRVASIDRFGRVRRAIPRKRHRPLGRSRSHGAGSKGPGRPAWASPQDAARDRRTSGRASANTSNGRQAGVGGQRRAASTYSHVLRSGRLVGTFGPP